MTERLLFEYALNASWQLPLLAAAAWLFARAARLRSLAEHHLCLAILALCVLVPALDLRSAAPSTMGAPHLASEMWVQPVPAPVLSETTARQSAALPELPLANPKVRHGIELHVTPRTLHILSALYASIVAMALLRFTRNALAAHRLLTESEQYALDAGDTALWHELTASLAVTLPSNRLRTSARISSPVVVGIFQPVLLLPTAFHACAEPERRAALAHELAHIRRHDCLVHAVSELVALPLIWHPILHAVKAQVARTREMVCDSIAARHMTSEGVYARSLLALAQILLHDQLSPNPASGMGLLHSKKLEERVTKLTSPGRPLTDAQLWFRRILGTGILAASLAAVAAIHLNTVLAQEVTSTANSTTPVVSPFQTVPSPTPQPDPAPIPTPQAQTPAAQPNRIWQDSDSGAIAHGKDAHVVIRDGQHVHRWIGTDGQPFEMVDSHAADLTPEQQREAEESFRQKMALTDKDLADMQQKLNSPEFKAQMQQMTDSALLKQTEQSQKAIADMQRKLDSSEFKAHINQITSDAVAKQLAQTSKLDLKQWDSQNDKQIAEALAELSNSDLILKKLDETQLQQQVLNTSDMEKRLADAEARMNATTKRLEEATRALREAQHKAHSSEGH